MTVLEYVGPFAPGDVYVGNPPTRLPQGGRITVEPSIAQLMMESDPEWWHYTAAKELRADTRVMCAQTLSKGSAARKELFGIGTSLEEVKSLEALLDGLGAAGTGEATIKACIYNAAGELLATSSEVKIAAGMALTWVKFPFTTPPVCPEGTYIVALHIGGTDRVARIYGDNFAEPTINRLRNPSFEYAAVGTKEWEAGFETTSIARSTTQARIGTASLQVTPQAGTTAAFVRTRNTNKEFTLNQKYSARASVYFPEAGTYAAVVCNEQSTFTKAADSGIEIVVTAAGWVDFQWTNFTYNKEDAHNKLQFRVERRAGAKWEAGQVFYLDRMMLVEGTTLPPYGDGDQAGWQWDGTPGESTSRGPQGRVNLIFDPRGVTPAAWVAHNLSIASVADTGTLSGAALELSNNSTSDPFINNANMPSISVLNFGDSEHTWTLSGKIKLNADAIAGEWTSQQHGPEMWWYSGGAYAFLAPMSQPTTEAWIPFAVEKTFPGIVYDFIRLYNALNAGKDPRTRYADLKLEEGSHPPGDTFSGNDEHCDWLGTPNESASIKWALPEVSDVYADGPAATSGLAVQAAKLPGTMHLRQGS